jgi:small subunit ribosomal protein S1
MSSQNPHEDSLDNGHSSISESMGSSQTAASDNGDQSGISLESPAKRVGEDEQAAAAGSQDFKPSPGWDRAAKSYQDSSTLELKVVGYNRGGLLADLSDVRGFVPASQLLNFPRRVGEEERMNELARYVGKTMRLKVIELDRVHNRLILSERVANLPISRAEQVINSIQAGQAIKGTVRNVTDFGAFVDLGGVEGLIHVSEMSWQRVNHPRDVCAPGTEIEVYVIDVNRDQRRVGLSLKRLRPDPWSLVAQHYHVGEIVDAVITNVVSFGAFARLPEGVEGLIHTSELAEGSFLHPRDVVKEGQAVKVRIMNIEPTRQRIGLTLRLDDDSRGRPREAPSGPAIPDAGYWDSLARES